MGIWTGRRGKYFWAVLGGEASLLVQCLPALVQGRRVVVASFDAGGLHLSAEELRDGWQQNGRVAVSPLIVDPAVIPSAGGDEWYVFEDAVPDFRDCETFVNYVGFSPVPDNEVEGHETWDAVLRQENASLQARFWAQLERISPWSYLADGDLVTFVTQSERERDIVRKVWVDGSF